MCVTKNTKSVFALICVLEPVHQKHGCLQIECREVINMQLQFEELDISFKWSCNALEYSLMFLVASKWQIYKQFNFECISIRKLGCVSICDYCCISNLHCKFMRNSCGLWQLGNNLCGSIIKAGMELNRTNWDAQLHITSNHYIALFLSIGL